jgi:hypothetical protein
VRRVGGCFAVTSLQSLELELCRVSPACAAALARLLRGGVLIELRLSRCGGMLDEPASALVLAAALQESATLTALHLNGTRVSAAVLLHALAGHRRLRTLHCACSPSADLGAAAAAGGVALGALVAANAHALTALEVSDCFNRRRGNGASDRRAAT